jgi:4-hydroxybenzoate polyprenyltransferase
MGLPALVQTMRPHQWVKNSFVLAPVLFSHQADRGERLVDAAIACVSFCLAASAAYLLNDVLDRDQDRLHPVKKDRPVASGRLGVGQAVGGAVVLAGAALVLGGIVGVGVLAIVGVYLALQIAYGTVLKHVVIVDVMVVAMGFVLRVMAGSAAVGVEASEWLLLCTLLLALFLGFSKRRQEIVTLGQEAAGGHRRVLDRYSPALLDQINSILLGATIVCYALYTVSPRTQEEVAGGRNLVFSVPLAIYGLLRYLYLVHDGDLAGSPTDALLRDRPLLFVVFLWAAYCSLVVYADWL